MIPVLQDLEPYWEQCPLTGRDYALERRTKKPFLSAPHHGAILLTVSKPLSPAPASAWWPLGSAHGGLLMVHQTHGLLGLSLLFPLWGNALLLALAYYLFFWLSFCSLLNFSTSVHGYLVFNIQAALFLGPLKRYLALCLYFSLFVLLNYFVLGFSFPPF